MTNVTRTSASRTPRITSDHPRYKWVALSNTTLGVLMATMNSSIVLISLPAIFRGIGINPLQPGNISYLLWMIMGYMLVTAVLVVTLGRLGDMYGRAKIYNAGFAVFTVASVALALDPFDGGGGAMWLILIRVLQGVGGAMLMANATAILTDAFPAERRGFAIGTNSVAAIGGSFIGLLVGGLLSEVDWRLVFWVSVPFGIVGTIWAYRTLHDPAARRSHTIDWWGNLTFGVGLILLLVGVIYAIQPYGDHAEGWTNPFVLGCLVVGVVVLGVFAVVETRVAQPMFHLELFRIRAFSSGLVATLMSALSRGGLQFMLIIWLQGIWLPLHGYEYEQTPLFSAIYMLPLTVGFLVSAPISGVLSDRFGARLFATGGLVIVAITFGALLLLPTDFNYWIFATVLLINGIGSGLFISDRGDELAARRPARRRQRDDVDPAELRDGALHRHLLLDAHRRARVLHAGGPVRRAHRAERARTGRLDGRRAPPGRHALRRISRVQPDAGDPRTAGPRGAPARRRRYPRGQTVLPEPRDRLVPLRARRRVRPGHRDLAHRGRRLAVPRWALRAHRRGRRHGGHPGRRLTGRPRAARAGRRRPRAGMTTRSAAGGAPDRRGLVPTAR